ncbi:MAG: hypothetical protein ACRBF0_02120 [Calditrichia bacterium]
MTKRLIPLCLLLFTLSVLADAVIVEFSAEPDRNKITLRWTTGTEDNVGQYVVERGLNEQDFTRLGNVSATGSDSQYEYVDENLSNVYSVYYYRLRIENTDGTVQLTDPISVIPNISSFSKTWGSIKALFQ